MGNGGMGGVGVGGNGMPTGPRGIRKSFSIPSSCTRRRRWADSGCCSSRLISYSRQDGSSATARSSRPAAVEPVPRRSRRTELDGRRQLERWWRCRYRESCRRKSFPMSFYSSDAQQADHSRSSLSTERPSTQSEPSSIPTQPSPAALAAQRQQPYERERPTRSGRAGQLWRARRARRCDGARCCWKRRLWSPWWEGRRRFVAFSHLFFPFRLTELS